MPDPPNQSFRLLSESELNRDDPYDFELHKEPVARNVNVANAFSLMKAAIELKVLQATKLILHISRTSSLSVSDQKSTIRRAMDRRERRIADIVDTMINDDFEEGVCEIASQLHIPPQTLPQRIRSPSEILEALETAEEAPREDELVLQGPSLLASSVGIHNSNYLVNEDATDLEELDENVRNGVEGVDGQGTREPSDLSSSIPTPGSGSVYSSLERSLSASNVHSVAPGPRQCKIVSAAQYTKIVSEREPQFSDVSQPYSIDSLVADSARIDRSALEMNTYRQLKSADSFPGEFPISEGLEYSSLATAKHHSRMPSIRTSVRPFSDL
ncbi:uncharacterized protein APUU_21114A [Aspergillus puulaauensis]|uniref:Uncharacterized protein n=1 Tax=Aspergillus puulaauensis TaxID=1220207 RepID=A0A7R8AJJ2_9EURO|nr:uncharacterized protein APUU_21114A [Aspergillus puulaauensis]BCS20682.1 hypothetical protein APUU_21114A [Aspergillus puulaauensis]